MMRRLLSGIGANLYAQAATTAIQLASVPLLLAAWGPARYGTWTLLTAMPAALTMADGGLVLASGNAMAMLAGRGDYASAAALYRRACRRVGLAVGVIALMGTVLIHGLPATLLPEGSASARPVLGLLLATTLLGVMATLPTAALRADGAYAKAVTATTTLRLGESALLVAIALAGGDLVVAALAWACLRLVATPWLFALAYRRIRWLRLRTAVPALPALMRPAAAAVLMPACFALALQGVTLAVGVSQPAVAVAAFSAVRTLTRALVQAVGLVIHALMPEMARATGRNDAAAVAALLRLSRRAALVVLAPGWLLLLLAGPELFTAWTGGRLPLPPHVLPLVASAAALHGLWLSRANLLLAVNRQGEFAPVLLGTTLATVALAALGAAQAGLAGAAAATLLGETAMVLHLASLGRRASPRLQPAGVLGR